MPSAPSRNQLVALVVALCFLAGAAGWSLARLDDGHASADSADVGFLYDMIRHHEQAVQLSRIQLLEGDEPGVTTFADEIIRFQSYEIGLMEGVLARLGHLRADAPPTAMAWMGNAVDAGEMPGLASRAELDGMNATDDVDPWFVALMIDHHAGGAAMAEAAAARVDDPVVRQYAEQMAKNQRLEIDEMLRAAEAAGVDIPPDGVTLDVYGADGGHEDAHED